MNLKDSLWWKKCGERVGRLAHSTQLGVQHFMLMDNSQGVFAAAKTAPRTQAAAQALRQRRERSQL